MTDVPDFLDGDELEETDPDEVRERLFRFLIKRDLNRHREIYDELADE